MSTNTTSRFFTNPWPTARDIAVEDLIIAVARYGNEMHLREMIGEYSRLDAYIIPGPAGRHSLGARYGNEGPEYLSFYSEPGPELEALLAKSRKKLDKDFFKSEDA